MIKTKSKIIVSMVIFLFRSLATRAFASQRLQRIHSSQIVSILFSTSEKNDQRQQTLSIDHQKYESETVVKKSRFVGLAKHCSSWELAQEFIISTRNDHPKARHVCYAFVAGCNNLKTERCSDDGEPTGTAGLPILGAINGEGLSNTVCVVVRYYGGVKLGASGLIRAYGASARQVLREADKTILIPKSTINLTTTSSNAGQIYAAAIKVGGVVEAEEYDVNGNLSAYCV